MESKKEKERKLFLDTLCSNYNSKSGIFKTFNKCQTSSACHIKCMKELLQYQQSDPDQFLLDFLKCVSLIFSVTDKSEAIDLSFDFAIKYCAYQYTHLPTDNSDFFFAGIFRFIFLFNDADSNCVRTKSCIFVNRVLSSLGPDCLLNEDIIVMISSAMRRRLKDHITSIRPEAVAALERLQEPNDEKCKVTRDLLFHMQHDPSALVRERIVNAMAICTRTLPPIVGRVKDIDANVRKATFKILSKLKVHHLSIKQRQTILSIAVQDKEESINSMVQLFVKTWFSNCNEDYLKFVAVLDPETIPEDTLKTALFTLFSMNPSTDLVEALLKLMDERNLIPLDQLTMEMASFWYHVILYFQNPPDNVVLDKEAIYKILPDLTPFVRYIAKFFNKSKENKTPESIETMIILLKMRSFFCLSDENGRNESIKMCKDLLLDPLLELRLIPYIVEKLPKLIECPKVRTRTIAEWVSDIREPLTDENDLEAEVEPKTDPETIIKCLTIIKCVLRSPDITKIDATLQTIKDHVIQPSFTVNNTKVLGLAQDTLGQLCLLDINLAKEQFLNYCIQLTEDEPTILSTSTVILDILAIHGLDFIESFAGIEVSSSNTGIRSLNKDKSFNNDAIKGVIQSIMDLFEHKDPEVSSIAVQGIARLFFTSNLKSPYIFGYFTLIWFCPQKFNATIRSILSNFFMTFIKLNSDADIIIESVVPTLRTIKNCQKDDPWCDVNMGKVSMFLVHLLSKECWTEKALANIDQEGSYHLRLAQTVCKKVSESSTMAIEIAHLLQLLELDADDGKFVEEMLSDLKKAINVINRKVDRKIITIYKNFKIEVEALQTNYYDVHKKHKNKELITSAKKARLSEIVEEQKDKETVPLESFVNPPLETEASPHCSMEIQDSDDESDEIKELNNSKWKQYRIEGTDDSSSD